MPARRLEDRIRQLCARAIVPKEPDAPPALGELRLAIQEHVLRLTNLTTAATVGRRPELIRERRNA